MKLSLYFYAVLTGFINAAIGSGAGMICVPVMKKQNLDQRTAQATTLAIILPLTAVSALIYAFNGDYSPLNAIKYVPFGLLGAVTGVKITKKIKNKFLKKAFALFMLWAGIRMLSG